MVRMNGCARFVKMGVLGITFTMFGYLVAANAQRVPPEPVKETKIGVLQHLEKIRGIVARHREEAKKKGLNFTTPPEDQLVSKLGRTNTPSIIFQSWNGSAGLCGTINYNVGIYNPDPYKRIWMFAHVFIGPANPVADIGDALQAVDTRFPRLTLPDFPGLSLDPAASTTLTFKVKVPCDVELSNYLGNSFLFRANWHDVGVYFDRSLFVFEVK